MAGGRFALCLVLGMVAPLAFGGCSMYLTKHVARPIRCLDINTARTRVLAELGQPRQSVTFSPPVDAPAEKLTPSDKATRRDEYVISGLQVTPGDATVRDNRWDWYPVKFVFTAGASELTSLPGAVGELARLSTERNRLRIWYGRADRLLTWDVRSVNYQEPPERPFGWALRPPDS